MIDTPQGFFRLAGVKPRNARRLFSPGKPVRNERLHQSCGLWRL